FAIGPRPPRVPHEIVQDCGFDSQDGREQIVKAEPFTQDPQGCDLHKQPNDANRIEDHPPGASEFHRCGARLLPDDRGVDGPRHMPAHHVTLMFGTQFSTPARSGSATYNVRALRAPETTTVTAMHAIATTPPTSNSR